MTTNDMTNSAHTPHLLLQHGYKYLELIGEGSNGKTYKAKNLKTGEVVAIKALKFSDNLKNYELFEREAKALKTIQTPGTPVFYDYITEGSEFTECWLVQEYIQGESIYDKLEKGETFDEAQTLEIILEAAQIVQTLQTNYAPPIIHRDIKPSNILVREAPKDGMKLCLIDFGAVANPQRRGVNSTVAGTVGYMAPEQLIGDSMLQSDYYALGATALHMLTGINPTNLPADGFTLQFEDTLRQKVPDIHIETIALLNKLLSANPSDRPKDANDLLQQITYTLSASNDLQMRLINKIHNYNFIRQLLDSRIYGFTFWVVLISLAAIIDYNFSLTKTGFSLAFAFVFILLISITLYIHSHISKLLDRTKADLQSLPATDNGANKETNLNTSKLTVHKTTGVVRAVFGNYIEYTAQINQSHYAAFTIVNNPEKYKIGDTIEL